MHYSCGTSLVRSSDTHYWKMVSTSFSNVSNPQSSVLQSNVPTYPGNFFLLNMSAGHMNHTQGSFCCHMSRHTLILKRGNWWGPITQTHSVSPGNTALVWVLRTIQSAWHWTLGNACSEAWKLLEEFKIRCLLKEKKSWWCHTCIGGHKTWKRSCSAAIWMTFWAPEKLSRLCTVVNAPPVNQDLL